ncbi:hypothetical protein Tco_0945616 [Tanacetum coccineum]
MFLYMDQLQKQLDNEEFQEIGSMSAFKVLQTQFGKTTNATNSRQIKRKLQTESKEQDTSSRSGNDHHVDDADIRPIYNEEPMAETFNTNHSSLVLNEKMFDHTVQSIKPRSSRQKTFEQRSPMPRPRPQGQKASDYDNSDPVPPRQNVVPTAEKTDSHYKREEVYVRSAKGFPLIQSPEKVYLLRKACMRFKQAPRAWYHELSTFLMSKGILALNYQHFHRPDHKADPETRKSTSGGIQSCDKLVSLMSKENKTATAILPAEQRMGVICKLAIKVNVDEDTTSRLWLQLQQNTVVLRLSVSHSNLMQKPRQHSRTKAHPYSDQFYSILSEGLVMKILTPDELEVLTNEPSLISSSNITMSTRGNATSIPYKCSIYKSYYLEISDLKDKDFPLTLFKAFKNNAKNEQLSKTKIAKGKGHKDQ